MDLQTRMRIIDVLLVFTILVGAPAISFAIGYAAWNGRPKNFSRELYWTLFVVTIFLGVALIFYAQRMHADVRSWQFLVQLACMVPGFLLFGVAGGFMIGIFTYRGGVKSPERRSQYARCNAQRIDGTRCPRISSRWFRDPQAASYLSIS